MNFPLFIAKRLYSEQGDKRKVSRPAIHIATAGVAIGLAVMIVSVCVVLGQAYHPRQGDRFRQSYPSG